ncbi:hypothetical protein [Vibrio coralliirubri]|nr:hypothetical protein [Vibrio coralliirubri]
MPNSMQGTHRKASKCIELGIQALKHYGLNPKMEKTNNGETKSA